MTKTTITPRRAALNAIMNDAVRSEVERVLSAGRMANMSTHELLALARDLERLAGSIRNVATAEEV